MNPEKEKMQSWQLVSSLEPTERQPHFPVSHMTLKTIGYRISLLK